MSVSLPTPTRRPAALETFTGSDPSRTPPRLEAAVWLADLTYTQISVSAETMPQAVAGLATYAATQIELAAPARIFKYPETLAAALQTDGPPAVIGFSHYIWNARLALGFAAAIKSHRPDTLVVFGGPHYPLQSSEQQRFWREHLAPVVDFYVAGEGEVTFALLLAALAAGIAPGDLHGAIPGLHSMDTAGRVHLPAPASRLPDLAGVPSPYLAGLMDPFFDGQLVPTVQTNRGCPFTCTFCVEGSRYYTKVAKKTREQVAAELRYIAERMAPLLADGRGRNELLITDSNFGMLPGDAATCDVIAECQDTFGWPRYVNVTTGKNNRDRVLDALGRTRGAMSLSGAVQSLDAQVLAHVRRANIDAGGLMDVALAAAAEGTPTYSEVILGLPGDSRAAHFTTLNQLVEAGFDRLNMFQLALLPGSELCTPAARHAYGMTTRFRVVPRCVGSYPVLGHTVTTAEIDEICITLPELPYPDYRQCRLMNLLIAACYNDGTFAALVKMLRVQQVPVFGWLELLRTLPARPRLAAVLDGFLADTDAQLWPSRHELAGHVETHIGRYLTGELGQNLIYTYRARALTEGLDDLAELAGRACLLAFEEAGIGDPQLAAFIGEATEYHRLRLAGVLTDPTDTPITQQAHFDLEAFLTDPHPTGLRPYLLPAPATRHFALSEEQAKTVDGYLARFGHDPGGAGRLLTKVRLTDLMRHTNTAAHQPA